MNKINIKLLSKYFKKIPTNIIYIILNYYGTNRNEYYIEKINMNKYTQIMNIPKIKKTNDVSYFVNLQKYKLCMSIYDKRCDNYICYSLFDREFNNNNFRDYTISLKLWIIYSDQNNGWVAEIED